MKLLMLLLLPILASCSSDISLVPAPPISSAGTLKSKTQTRQIQKTGTMDLRSRSLKKSSDRSIALVSQHRGILSSSSLTKDDYNAQIRVPSTSLEPLMASLQEVGKITHKRVSMDDVTEQYLDLEAALKNKRALRDRLRKLLVQATKIKDVLKIEEQLARVQTELDQMEGRMKLMRSQVAFSTLHLSIEREKIPGPVGIVTKSVGWVFGKLIDLN